MIMKKSLSLVLVLMMLLSSFAFATPADVVGTGYEVAVDRLSNFGILKGYPDGSFKPTATISRAEFAAVVVRSLGIEPSANVSSMTKYKDVPSNHWASGYISIATGLGVIKGYTTGNFGPSDPVTYEQAIAMVVRSLGYEPSIAAKGGYPAGYLVVASENNLLKGITGKVGEPASRGFVAMLVNNALETPLMIQTTYGSNVQYVVTGLNGVPKQTLLTDKIGLIQMTKKVNTVNMVDQTLTFVGDSNTYKASSWISFDRNMVDLEVSVLSKDNTVYSLTVISQVIYDYIDGTKHNASEVTLVNANKAYAVDPTAISTLNGGAEETPALVGAGYDNSFGKFILNSNNKIVRAQMVTSLNKQGIITSITDTTIKYANLESSTGAIVSLSNLDTAVFGFVSVNEEIAMIKDLIPGMYLETFVDGRGVYYIAASSTKIVGILESVRTDLTKVTIAGVEYNLGSDARFSNTAMDAIADIGVASDLNTLNGTKVFAYRNARNEVAFITGSESSATTAAQVFYGVLKEASTFNEQIKVHKIVSGEIELTTYSTKLTRDDANLSGSHYVTAYDGALTSADVYQFVLNSNGVVIEIKAVAGITNNVTTTTIGSIDASNDSFLGNNGIRYFIEADTAIFSLDGGTVKAYTWAVVEMSNITDGMITVNLPTGDSTPSIVVITDDANNQIGSSTGNFILAYAPTSPSLSGGKYLATVKTMAGNLSITVDSSDLNGWNDDKAVLVLQKRTNGQYIVVDVEHGNDFFTAGALTALDDHYTDLTVVSATDNNLTLVNGQFLTLNGTVYKVADNALIYRSYNDGGTINVSEIGDLTASDTATFVHDSGIIQMLIYKR
jgi:hypothetical protein